MERIKDITKIKLNEFEVLMQVHQQKTKSGLITSVDKKGLGKDAVLAYGEILAVGEKVMDLLPGDIIVKTREGNANGFEVDKKEYAIVPRHQVLIAVEKSNFDASTEISA